MTTDHSSPHDDLDEDDELFLVQDEEEDLEDQVEVVSLYRSIRRERRSRTCPMETIFESGCEDEDGDVDEIAKMSSNSRDILMVVNKVAEPALAPSCPRLMLQQNVLAWCETTGLPTTVRVHIADRSFELHELPLVSRSGYFKRVLSNGTNQAELGDDFPGGPDIFAMVASFCYGGTILVEPGNVAVLRCAAEYLEMGEEFGKGNLSELSDMYLRKVALQSWHGSFAVLRSCENLLPLAEELLIVSRCIDSLAFIACTEVLDRLEGKELVSGKQNEKQQWFWVEELLQLPYSFFIRTVAAIRRQGMREKYIAKVVMRFAERWILGAEYPTRTSSSTCGADFVWCQSLEQLSLRSDKCRLLESVVRLLPLERHVLPVSFLFSLLRRALQLGASTECRVQLETRIASQLEQATLEDFFTPASKEGGAGRRISKAQIESTRQIVCLFVQQQQQQMPSNSMTTLAYDNEARFMDFQAVARVAEVWDCYLEEIAYEPGITPVAYADLIDIIPACARENHDQLYKAIHVYLKAHPHVTHSERMLICKPLNCQKLSQQACIHAVQNELMPLRTIVQAMFMEQLQKKRTTVTPSPTPPAFEHPDHEPACKEIRINASSTTINSSSSSWPMPKRSSSHRFQLDHLGKHSGRSSPLDEETQPLQDDYEDAKLRLKQLELELAQVKKTLKQKSSLSSSGPNSSCIGHVLYSQRTGINLGHRLLKTLRKLGLRNLWRSSKYNACYDVSSTATATSTEDFGYCERHQLYEQQQQHEQREQLLHFHSAAPSPQHSAASSTRRRSHCRSRSVS